VLNKFSIWAKINSIVALIFLLVITVVTLFSLHRERLYIQEIAEEQVRDLTTWYFDSLNTMMLTGTMDQRSILRGKLLARPQVIDARVVRGDPVNDQFGPGLPEEAPVDELDYQALTGESVVVIDERSNHRVITVLTPFRATESTRGVNCLRCHHVPSGSVNGAIRVSYSLAKMDAAVEHESMLNIITNMVLFAIGMLLINIMIYKWFTVPFNDLLRVVNRRSSGDINARVKVTTTDEFGSLGRAFNTMSENINAVTEREHNTAIELQTKVDVLLTVVRNVTKGDFSTEVGFSGDDAIGELAGSLQGMVNYIRDSIAEKHIAVEDLQRKVDAILRVVMRTAEGDLTGEIKLEGADAIARLAAGVQDMIGSVNALVAQIQRSGVQMTASATEISSNICQVETTAIEQASTTNQITTTATEISATSKALVRTMDEVASVAEQATHSAVNSQSGLIKMESLMRQVVESASIIAEKLQILNERATNINTVVTTITKVADQTNLLSLNAAIEAEKAGEYGRGFAVVATEIRRLADQTAVATLDIERMIKEMQDSVISGVRSMTSFTDQVRESVAEVQLVSQQQAKIIEQVQTLGPRFESVQRGMHSQSDGAVQINQAMLQLNDAAQQTVAALRLSNTAIARLNDAAKGLHSSVSKFKVVTLPVVQ